MNEIKTNASQEAATPSSVESIHLTRKLIYQRILTTEALGRFIRLAVSPEPE
jgi:hypothetical protein